jgi:long-chain acyl-CoA synthetase
LVMNSSGNRLTQLTVTSAFSAAVAEAPDQAFLSWVTLEKDAPPVTPSLSFKQVSERVYQVANFLVSRGAAFGDRVAVVSDNCPENIIVMLGALFAGCVIVPIYPFDLKTETVRYQLVHSGVRFCFYENEGQRARTGFSEDDCELLMSFAALKQACKTLAVTPPTLAEQIGEETTVLHLYTSGSSGIPKCVVRNHGSLMKNVGFFADSGIFNENDRIASVLPFPHIFPFAVIIVAVAMRLTLVLSLGEPSRRARKNPVAMMGALQQGNCHTLIVVPQILEKIKGGIEKRLEGNRLAQWALEVSLANYRESIYRYCIGNNVELPSGFSRSAAKYRSQAWIAPLLRPLLRKIAVKALGPNIRVIATGGSALSYELGEFFEQFAQVLQGYGSTESGITHAQLPNNIIPGLRRIPGNVGVPLSQEIGLLFDESLGLLVRTPTMMTGYYDNPTANEQAFAERRALSWYCLSDKAHVIDQFGSLVIDGRADREYKNLGGEKVQPEYLEGLITKSPLIAACVVWGAGKPRNTVIVSLDEVAAKNWAESHGVPLTDLPESQALKAELEEFIRTQVNTTPSIRKYEQIHHLIIARERFTTENDLLTGNGKVRYKRVLEAYRRELEAIYGS